MDKFDDVISIGYICNVSMLLGTTLKNVYPFDRAATPMWAVTQLIETDFTNFMLKDAIEGREIFENENLKKLKAVDKNYYIRMIMKTPLSEERYTKFSKNIFGARDRFIERINSGNRVLFIRSREPMVDVDGNPRIIYPEYQDKYSKDETEYLKDFSKLLKRKYPTLDFSILHMSGSDEELDEEHRIVTIPEPDILWTDPRIGRKMTKYVADNRDYIDESLNKLNPEFIVEEIN
jgi:hypothetical protein